MNQKVYLNILNQNITLTSIIQKASVLFNSENTHVFNKRIFIEQLSYYNDVSYEEKVTYCSEFQPKDEENKEYLMVKSISYLHKHFK